MHKKVFILLIPFLCVLVLLATAVLWMSGYIILDYGRYFSVDEAGRVYLGVDQSIYVYEDSLLVGKIPVGRGIEFTIEDDQIVAYGEYTTVYTLDGEIISREEGGLNGSCTQYGYTSEDGTNYSIRYPFGRFSIYSESSHTPIYQMPLLDYSFGIAALISLIGFSVWCCVVIVKLGRNCVVR